MIKPTPDDIGREVCYIPAGKYTKQRAEFGEVTSYNDRFVFVRYDDQASREPGKATSPGDLWWADDVDVDRDGLATLKRAHEGTQSTTGLTGP